MIRPTIRCDAILNPVKVWNEFLNINNLKWLEGFETLTWSLMMQIKVLRRRMRNCTQHEVGNDEQRDGRFSSESNSESVAWEIFSPAGVPMETVTCAIDPETSE